MNTTKIFYDKKVKLNDPILLVGLPGIGNVGSLVGRYLKKALKAKRLATVYSPHFPHQAVMMKNGSIRLVSNRFYYYKNPKGKHDLVILIGDVQAGSPEGQYEVNDKIIKFFKHIGGKRVYTIGGYNLGNQYIQKPRVFGVASDKALLAELEKAGILFGKASGMIWGSAGLIVAFAKMQKLQAACIMGETGLLEMDANSAKHVLEVINPILGLKVDLENMERIKQETEKMLKNLEEMAKTQAGEPTAKPSGEAMTYIR